MVVNMTYQALTKTFAALADALEQAGPAILGGPSLCAGWSAGNVLAHVTMAARNDQESFRRELAAAGFDFETRSQTIAARDAQLPFASLLGDLRRETMATWTPPAGARSAP